MNITLTRLSGSHFECRNERGQVVEMDGPADVGGQDKAMRPMEMVLNGLAGCSAVDVLLILEKSRVPIKDLRVEVEATRADAIPAVFETIDLTFIADQGVPEAKLKRAVDLSLEKYCSVARMLQPGVTINGTFKTE